MRRDENLLLSKIQDFKSKSNNEFHIIFLRHYPNVRRGENRVKLSALFDHQSERSNVVHDVSGYLAGIGNARALLLQNH
jgi:hypothetical protein